MTPAVPTGGDERVEAGAQAIYRVRPVAGLDWDEVHQGVYENYRAQARAALAAADAVAAQDPEPTGAPIVAPTDTNAAPDPVTEPVAWTVVGDPFYDDRHVPAFLTREWAETYLREVGGEAVRALYAEPPAPAPVVPDEADQATAEVDYISDEGTAYRVTINGTTWRSGPEETAEDLRREVQAHTALLRARLAPPAGGDR